MQWCVSFPQQDSLLILRASLKRACGGNKAAAAFLSYLLYQVSISQQYTRNAEQINRRKLACGEVADQLVTIDIYRSQKDIVQEMDGHLSDRTLRDTAIPLLVGLGYIEVDETEAINIYRVHLDAVQAGIDHPPSAAEVGARLRQLAGSGTFSARYQKAFHALAEVFPLPDGKTSAGNGKTSAGNGKTSAGNGKTSAPLMSNQPASGAGASTESARGKKRKKKEVIQEEVEAEAARVVRVEPDAQAAAAAFSEEDSFLSNHDEPTPGPGRVDEEQTQPASASLTALSAHMLSEAPLEPELARHRAGESSLTTSSRPADSTPTSSAPEQPIAPTLSGAQAQASGSAFAEPLSSEAMVTLVERLLGNPYDSAARARQLQAARQLLAMKLLPDLSTLSRLYALCYDDWWRQHYGPMHLTHLVEREKSGQPRILRLLARLTPPPVAAWTPGSATAPSLRPAVGRTAVGSQSRQSEEEADAWLKQNQQDSLEKLLRNGDHLVAKMRAAGDREAERLAACLQLLKQQQAQQQQAQGGGGMACND